ncbi:unnamed protein product, partial [Phaeothamnion confervicola]
MSEGASRPRRQTGRNAKQQAALEKIKAARGGCSRLEQYGSDDDEPVWEDVTEEEYQRTVRERQEKGDFVVDDNGLGYADNGEEFIGRMDEDEASELTDESAFKARG